MFRILNSSLVFPWYHPHFMLIHKINVSYLKCIVYAHSSDLLIC